MKTQTLRGVATVNFYAADHQKAKEWYTAFLGIEPYFEQTGYAEFRIGDYQTELGLIDIRYLKDHPCGPAGVMVYWHVDDINTVLEKLLSMGASQHEALKDRGSGFVTASVIDPFGNLIGIMNNPHYQKVVKTINN